jgi:uncharacterized protein YerC
VIDFMNVQVLKYFVPEETKTKLTERFHIKRYLKDGHIYKEIEFEDKGQDFLY